MRRTSSPAPRILEGIRVALRCPGALCDLECDRRAGSAGQHAVPRPGAKGVCPDTPLRIRFQGTPLAGSGTIEVRDSADDSVVATIDVATPTRTCTIGGLPNFRCLSGHHQRPRGHDFLPGNTLGYNKTYFVTVDAGAFKDATGAPHAGVRVTPVPGDSPRDPLRRRREAGD